jgi:3-oxoacyl-[acyl-carrier-protein] synthase II
MADRRVVVTGMGLVSSLGETVSQYWANILAGKSGIGPIRRFDVSAYSTRIAGEMSDWNPDQYLDSREAKRVDRFSQFALVCAAQAIEDSGLTLPTDDPYRCGVLIGSGIGGLHEIESQFEKLLEKGPDRVSPFLVPKLMINAASGLVSIRYGLKGPNTAVAAACASANNAIGDAFKVIQRNEADVMITGGAEAAVTRIGLAGFCSMKALSTRNDDPTHASRPFDRDRDGFVMGEGAAIFVLEEYEHARRRGAKIYAEVAGYGMAGDGTHITAPDSEGRGAAYAMRDALHDAGLAPEDISYVNAHGTSTPLGDAMEVKAIKAVYGAHAQRLAVSSTKSFVGHLLGASGAVELVATIMGMQDKVVHATLNLENPDEGFDLNFVPKEPQPREVKAAMSNSFGFGGHNAVLVVKKV